MTAWLGELTWVPALGWTLLHFLWQGAVVGIVFALLRAFIPARNCQARYWNGLIALLAMAVLPVLTFVSLRAQDAAAPIGTLPAPDTAPDVMASVPGVATVVAPLEALLPWVVALWLAGVLLVGLRSWRQWRVLVQVARMWSVPDARLQELAASLAVRFGFARRFRVLVSDRIDTPTLIGWLKPVILLPAAVALGFPRQQIELILAHELGHLRRYDHLVNLAQAIVETLLFYHPAVHWIAREVRNEREICCDELVLQITRGEPREYASTLAALEELRQPPVHLALAASGGVLLERVRRILFAPHPVATRVGSRMWLPMLTVLAVVLVATARIDRDTPVYVDIPLPWSDKALLVMGDMPASDVLGAHRIARPRFALVDVRPAVPHPTPDNDAVVLQSSRPAAVPLALPLTAPLAPTSPQAASLVTAAVVPAPSTASLDTVAGSRPEPKPRNGAEARMPTAAAPPPMPVATRTVAPEYPDMSRDGVGARVELSFTIDADGGVRNIAVVDEAADKVSYARAAKRALRQWRFRPASVGADGTTRYRQAFVFSPQAQAEEGCVRRTGSQLCQRGDNATPASLAAANATKSDLAYSGGR